MEHNNLSIFKKEEEGIEEVTWERILKWKI